MQYIMVQNHFTLTRLNEAMALCALATIVLHSLLWTALFKNVKHRIENVMSVFWYKLIELRCIYKGSKLPKYFIQWPLSQSCFLHTSVRNLLACNSKLYHNRETATLCAIWSPSCDANILRQRLPSIIIQHLHVELSISRQSLYKSAHNIQSSHMSVDFNEVERRASADANIFSICTYNGSQLFSSWNKSVQIITDCLCKLLFMFIQSNNAIRCNTLIFLFSSCSASWSNGTKNGIVCLETLNCRSTCSNDNKI